jgi:hypothetical protein
VYTDDFIGSPKNKNIFFSHSDNEINFKYLLKTQPTDWYYRDNPINYIRNRLGHRCKNIEDIDLNNYFLTTGCSNTEGIGLHLEDTYSHVLSETLNCDYYNLSLGGTGIDILFYNLVTWLSKVKQKPKFIVLQNPTYTRFSLKEGSTIGKGGPWIANNSNLSENDQNKLNFFVLGDEIQYFEHQYEMKKKMIKNIVDVPIIDVYFPDVKSIKEFQLENVLFLNIIDKARDNAHAGRLSNKQIANQISTKLQTVL